MSGNRNPKIQPLRALSASSSKGTNPFPQEASSPEEAPSPNRIDNAPQQPREIQHPYDAEVNVRVQFAKLSEEYFGLNQEYNARGQAYGDLEKAYKLLQSDLSLAHQVLERERAITGMLARSFATRPTGHYDGYMRNPRGEYFAFKTVLVKQREMHPLQWFGDYQGWKF